VQWLHLSTTVLGLSSKLLGMFQLMVLKWASHMRVLDAHDLEFVSNSGNHLR